MVNVASYSKTGSKHETTVKLDQSVFGVEPSPQLIAQAYRTYLANGRSAQASTLKRGDVAGGGKKPWRQKGTGRARVGSIRVPHWRGGGIVFGPTGNENHTLNLPTRMKRLAIKQALSLKAQANQIMVLDELTSTDGRVKPITELLSKLKLSGNILLVVPEKTDTLLRATRNIEGVELVSARYLNVFTIMNADHIVIVSAALDVVKDWLGEK